VALPEPEVVETPLSQTLHSSQEPTVDDIAHSPDPTVGSNTSESQSPTPPPQRAPGSFGQSKPDPFSIRARYTLAKKPLPSAVVEEGKPKGWFSQLFKL
jgi:hypothetical protein